MAFREEKLKTYLMELAAKFIANESVKGTLTTVTNCDLSPKHNFGTIYITVLPENKELEVQEYFQNKAGEMRKFIFDNLKIRAVPSLKIEIDYGEKNRQRVEEISTLG